MGCGRQASVRSSMRTRQQRIRASMCSARQFLDNGCRALDPSLSRGLFNRVMWAMHASNAVGWKSHEARRLLLASSVQAFHAVPETSGNLTGLIGRPGNRMRRPTVHTSISIMLCCKRSGHMLPAWVASRGILQFSPKSHLATGHIA